AHELYQRAIEPGNGNLSDLHSFAEGELCGIELDGNELHGPVMPGHHDHRLLQCFHLRLRLPFLFIACAVGHTPVFPGALFICLLRLHRTQHRLNDFLQRALRKHGVTAYSADCGNNFIDVYVHSYTANPTAALTAPAARPTPGNW